MKKQMKALEKLMKKGDYFESLKFWLEVLNREDKVDIEHLNFIDMGIEICVPLYGKRHFDLALDGFRTVYEKRREIMGPKHLDTLNALRRVIRARFEKGEVEEAFDMCSNLDDCIAVEKTMATELFNRGEYERALHFFQRAHEEAVESLGAEDAETLSLRLLVARVLSTLGRHRESMEVSKEVAEKREKILGATHSFTLIAWRTVALSLLELNEGDECLSVLNKTYQKAVRVLGNDHPDLQLIQKQIAQTLSRLGRNMEAVRVYQDILEHQDPKKPEFLETKDVILDLLLKLGKPDEARHVYNMVYEILVRKYTEEQEHDILEGQIKKAENYAKEGKFKEAADQYRQIYNVRKEVFGSEDSKALYSQYKIAEMLLKAGECGEAFSIVSDLLEKRVRTLGLENGDTLQTMMLKAQILARQEKFHDSTSVMEQIISVRDKMIVTSDNVSDFVIALTNAGGIYCLMGDYNRALHNFTKASRLRERYPRYTNVMGSDKDVVLSLWNSRKALEIVERFKELRQLCYDSPKRNYNVILNIQMILGEFLYLVGSYEESLDCFKNAHKILTCFPSVEDNLPAVLQTKVYMGKILFLQSKLDDALKALKYAYAQIVLSLGRDHPESKAAEHKLLECLRARKAASEADSGANVIGAEGGSTQSGSGVKESVEGEESVEMKDASVGETKRGAGTSKGQSSKIRSPSKPLQRSSIAAEDIIAKKVEEIIDALGESKSGMESKDAENNLVRRLKAKAASEIDSEANVISAEGGSQSGSEVKESVEGEESVEMKDVSAAETKSVEMKDVSAAETKSIERGAGTSKGQRSKICSPSKPSLPISPTATGNIIEKKLEEIIIDALGESKSEK